jgi:hypothetical protein
MIDMMTLITMCLKYAKNFNRILVIDTRKSLHFKDGFRKYFYISNSITYKDDLNTLYANIKDKILYPNKNRKSLDYLKFNPFIDENPTIDMTKDYKEDIILYGNDNKHLERDINFFFRNFTVKPIILDIFKQRLEKLPNNYISVHVRNTDYKSNVDKFIKDNYDKFNNKSIFLASDDNNTIEKFRIVFSNKNIYNFMNMNMNNKYKNNHPIHIMKRNVKDHEQFNIDTMTDFLLLKNGKEYYYSCKQSGFSRAVEDMRI